MPPFAAPVDIFLTHYRSVMIREKRGKIETHVEAYVEYLKGVPRFVPNPALYRRPEKVTVDVRLHRRSVTDVVWFVRVIISLEIIDRLYARGIVPVPCCPP